MARKTTKPTPETVEQLMRRLVPNESWIDFAARADISAQTMRRLRWGLGKRPFRTTLAKLAKAAKCSIEEWEHAIDASIAAAK